MFPIPFIIVAAIMVVIGVTAPDKKERVPQAISQEEIEDSQDALKKEWGNVGGDYEKRR